MRTRAVRFSLEARSDLLRLYRHIVAAAGPEIAGAYLRWLRGYCAGFETASQRGRRRDDIARNLFVVGFE